MMNFNAFLRFHCLMQTVAPSAALHCTAGVFINDDNLTVLNDIVNILLKKHVCTQCRHHVM